MANTIEFTILGKDQFTKTMNSTRAAINDTVKILSGFGVVAAGAMGVAAKQIINVGDKTETLRLRMNAMLGDVALGNQVFQDMAEFAGQVPFAYEEIMESATQLSGVMKGGVDEINQWMPMIADLAAVSGLGIQQTTEQVVRMYSAGAGAADLFRERGINAMLGFEAGVSYSADETQRKLIEAFENPMSKFRGASAELATTWTGVMSMIGDKWFNIQSQIADSGVFNYFKSIAMVVDEILGGALEDTKNNAEAWANVIIGGIRSIFTAVGWVANAFRGWQAIWVGLKFGLAKFVESAILSFHTLANSIRDVADLIPGINPAPLTTLNNLLASAQMTSAQFKKELEDIVKQEMPSDVIEDYVAKVEANYNKLQAKSEETKNAQVEHQKEVAAVTLETMDANINKVIEANQKELELRQTYATEFGTIYDAAMTDIFNNALTMGEVTSELIKTTYDNLTTGIGDAIGGAIAAGENLGKAMKKLLQTILKNIISTYITATIQRWIMSAQFGAASATDLAIEGSKAVALAGANGVASWAAAPWPINTGAPAFGKAMAASAKAQLIAGALHGGMDNVPNEATYLLQKGERVLSPNQNTDLTNFLNGEGGGTSGTTVENINVVINTTADNFVNIDDEDLVEFVAGRIIPALDTLDDNGVRQAALESGAV